MFLCSKIYAQRYANSISVFDSYLNFRINIASLNVFFPPILGQFVQIDQNG